MLTHNANPQTQLDKLITADIFYFTYFLIYRGMNFYRNE